MQTGNIRKYIRRGITIFAIFLITVLAGEFIVSYGHEQGWFENTTGKVNLIMTLLTNFVNNTYFIWACFTTAGLTIGMWTDFFLKRKESPISIGDSKQIDYRDRHKLAAQQAIYIKNNEDIRTWFNKLMKDEHLKLPWKPKEDGSLLHIGKMLEPPDGMTMKEAAEKAGVDWPFGDLVNEMMHPDDLQCTSALRYFLENDIVEEGKNIPNAVEKLQWYFPTNQAELVLKELARLNRKRV